MQGVRIIETEVLNQLITEVRELKSAYVKTLKETKVKDPLLTSKELELYLKKGSTWIDANKHNIGCSRVGGEWRFRLSVVEQYLNSTHHKNWL